MKWTTGLAFVLMVGMAGVVSAQRPENGARPGRPGQGGPQRGNPMSRLDTDGDGAISMAEIDAMADRLKALDKDGDGKVTKEEFAAQMGQRPGPEGRPQGKPGEGRPQGRPGEGRAQGKPGEGRPDPEAFIAKVMESDTNGDGKISKEEAPERMQRAFDRLDADGSGDITKEELETIAKRMGQGRPGEGRGRPGEGRPGEGRGGRPGGADRPKRGGDGEE